MRGRHSGSLVVVVLCAVQFVDVLGVTSATTAIPVMVEALATPAWATGVIATSYAAFFGGFLILGARLGDRYGARRVLVGGLVLFVVAGAVGATATGLAQLSAGRAAQGLAAAISVPAALGLLLHATSGDRRRTAVAAWGASGAAAGALGFLVGGFVTEWWSWRGIFWVNVPIGVLLVVLVVGLAPRRSAVTGTAISGGAATVLVAATMGVVVGASLVERPELRAVGAVVAGLGLVLAAGLVAQQRRTARPLVPPAAFRTMNVRTGTAVSFVNTATTSATGVLVALHLQQQLGASPLEAGLRLVPFSLAVVVGSGLAKPLARRLTDRRLAATGLGGVAVGNAVLAVSGGSRSGILVGVGLTGLGLGIAAVAATTIGTTVPDDLAGTATGLLNTGAQLGTALGVAALVTVANGVGTTPDGTLLAWLLVAVLAAVSAALLLRPAQL